MVLKFTVRNQILSALDTGVAPLRGSANYLQLQFSFVTKEWLDLRKTLYISSGEYASPFELTSNVFDVPTYFTQQSSFSITLLGDDDSGVVVPTNVLSISLAESNTLWTAQPPDPENSAYLKLLTAIGDLANLATKDKSSLVAAINELSTFMGTEEAVLYTEQNLTEEQQAQARENIGAVAIHEVEEYVNTALGVIENGTY